MSLEIDVAFVDQFTSNVIHLAQQKGSRLRDTVRHEDISGKRKAFERIGHTAARKRTSRHSDTPRMEVPHSRRWLGLADYDWADLVDKEDEIRLLISPTSHYAKEASYAMGRAMDDVIIEAYDAPVFTGENGDVVSTFDANQEVGEDVGGTDTNLNVEKLIETKSLFGVNDVDEDLPLILVVTQYQLDALLRQTEVTNSDYNTVKALAAGKVDSFMGFNFKRTQRLPKTGAVRSCYAYVSGEQSPIILGVGKDINSRMSERADKNYALQVFFSMSIGATRVTDQEIVRVLCTES